MEKKLKAKMSKANKAVELYDKGYSCSQAVLSVFTQDFDLAPELTLKISTAFGGGMAGTEGTCGTLTGALMVIGLRYGKVLPDDSNAKAKTYKITKELFTTFENKNKSLLCGDLKLKDTSTDEKKRLSHEICNKYIYEAVQILEELFQKYPV